MSTYEVYKDNYVYELVDSRNNFVFYVGKGRGERAFQHKEEASKSDKSNDKLNKIREIEEAGSEVKVRVIGRYETEDEAFAVESTLVHWVYGYDNLTNVQSGHGNDSIRENGNYDEIEGIDIFTAGTYSQKREAEKDRYKIEEYMNEVKKYLESNINIKLSAPHSKNPKWTSISFELKKIKVNIGTSNETPKKTLSIQIEPTEGKKEYRDIIKKICDVSMFEFKDDGRYARMENYKILNSNGELLNTFINILKELNKSFVSLTEKEMDLNIKKDFEIMKNIVMHIHISDEE